MKLFLTMVVLIAISNMAYGQTVLGPEQVIKRIIDSGISEGHDQKILGGMGDAAAVLVTKVVAGRHLGTNDIDGVLVILNISFAGQAQVASDQDPRTALFVLRCLESSTQDSGLLQRIHQTRKYIQTQPSATTKTPTSRSSTRRGVATH